jgi:hypothetical protein
MNTASFLADQQRYFEGAYQEFVSFGGPSVYFHNQCLSAGADAFLSERHIEMLYATLTAWGMHRMGDPEDTKTKLKDWNSFHRSIVTQGAALQKFRHHRLLSMSESEYSEAVLTLKPLYRALNLSVSDATVVVNSKALFHLFPEFIPPIDRQYTIRFFTKAPERWLDSKGKFRMISLPARFERQFELFHKTCLGMKRLADRVDPGILERERTRYGVTAPKAMDNAILNYVKKIVASLRSHLAAGP